MAEEKLLTVRDASLILNISEKEVLDLAESGALPAYKIAGVYLRFKKEQVYEFKKKNLKALPELEKEAREYSFKDRLGDFIYFNDFYIVTVVIVAFLVFIILKG